MASPRATASVMKPGARRSGLPTSRRRLLDRSHRGVLVVIVAAVVIGPLFGASFSFALGRQTPHDLPVGLVGRGAALDGAAAALEAQTRDGITFRQFPSTRQARRAIDQQEVYGLLDEAGGRPELSVAGTEGSSVVRTLELAAEGATGGGLPVVDIRPLPSSDPLGLIPFYLTLASTVTGFVSMIALHGNAPPLRLRHWLLCLLAVAVGASLLLAVLVHAVIGALPGPLWELWVISAASVGASGLWSSTMLAIVRRWVLIPTFGLLMVLGVPASGGPAAPQLLPDFYGLFNRFLPPGATERAIRNAAYFQHDQHVEPLAVLSVWIVGLLLILTVLSTLTGRTPSGEPVEPHRDLR